MERYCELADKTTQELTKSQHHALTTTNSRKKKWDLLEKCQKVCSQIVLKCMYLARIGRLDISWSVNKQTCSCCQQNGRKLVTNAWRIQHTCDFKFRKSSGYSDFVGDLEDSKSTSGGFPSIFGSHTFVPIIGCARNRLQFHTVLQKLK